MLVLTISTDPQRAVEVSYVATGGTIVAEPKKAEQSALPEEVTA